MTMTASEASPQTPKPASVAVESENSAMTEGSNPGVDARSTFSPGKEGLGRNSSRRLGFWGARARRTALVWWALAPILLLSQLAFLREFRDVLTLYRSGRFTYHQADAWRHGTPPVAHLARFLGEAERLIPAGRRVIFSSRDSPGDQAGHRLAWATYLLPDHRLATDRRSPEPEADYWIAYRTSPRDEVLPRLELLLDEPDGRVYRVKR